MIYLFALAWGFSALHAFQHFPTDEALVRTVVLALAYVCAYVVVRTLTRLVQWVWKSGRANLPKF